MAKAKPRAGELTTANYSFVKPTVGASDDVWGGFINANFDSIDSVVHGIQTSVPAASTSTPLMDGTAAVGTGVTFARADHIHPSDTTKYNASNPSGYQTAAQVTAALPVASSTTPTMNGVAAIGTGTTWATADHVHPVDTSRYAATNPSGYQTAAQVTASLGNYLRLSGGTLSGDLRTATNLSCGGNVYAADQAGGTQGGLIIRNNTLAQVSSFSFNFNTSTASFGNNLGTTGNCQINYDGSLQISSATAIKPSGGSWAASSDARIKAVEGDYTQGLGDVLKLRPVIYRYLGNDTPHKDEPSPHALVAEAETPYVGLIAQEVEAIFPGMVTTYEGFIDGEPVADLRRLDTGSLIFTLVNAVKTLAARVTELEAAR